MIRLLAIIHILIVMIALYRAVIIYKKSGKAELISVIKGSFLPSLALSLTVGLFLPTTLVISNSGDFLIGIRELLPVVILFSLILFLFLISISVLIMPSKFSVRWCLFLTSLVAALYIQSSWINPKLPELTGQLVDWSRYRTAMILDGIVWLVILLLPQLLFHKISEDKFCKICKTIPAILLAIQGLALVILLLLPRETVVPNVRFSNEGKYMLGSEKNIVIFVMDSLGADNYEAAVEEYPDILVGLEDFTYFSNEIAGGSYTELGIPTLMTGVEYDPEHMSYGDYLDDAWGTVDIYDKLSADGYDIRFYTDNRYVRNLTKGVVDNVIEGTARYHIGEKIDFTRKLYRLVGYYSLPTSVKRFFHMNTTDITQYIVPLDEDNTINEDANDEESVFFNDISFYEGFTQAGGFTVDQDKAYRLYHMIGPHEPYILDVDGTEAPGGVSTENRQTAGCFHIVNEMIEDMRTKGIYDSSTIIITADHGPGGAEHGIQQNSCLLVKSAGASHKYDENDAPVHARNLMATIADEAGFDYLPYGPRIWDIDGTTDVERLHTARRASAGNLFPDIPEDVHSVRFVIGGDATDVDSITQLIGSERNRIEYSVGDMIDLSDTDKYSGILNTRLYYDDTGATASNELYLYFVLKGYNGNELRFNFVYDNVYNNSQRMRIYAEGERVATLDCKTEDAGNECTVVIPSEYIRNNILPLRIVFPGAVMPKMLDDNSDDERVMSVHFNRIWLSE